MFANWTVTRSSVGIIQRQPDFGLSLLPTLPDDQANLRQHANDYEVDISGQLQSIYQIFISANRQFQNMGAPLLEMAKALDASSDYSSDSYKAQKEQFNAILGELQRVISIADNSSSTLSAITNVHADLNAFYNEKIETDQTTFAEDYTTAKGKYAKDVEALETKLDNLQGEIDDYNSQMAQGAISQIPASIAFGVSIGQAAKSATSSGAMVINMGVKIAKFALDEINFAEQYDELNDNLNSAIESYGETITALEDEEEEMSILKTLANQVATFSTKITTGVAYLASIVEELTQLKDEFGILIERNSPETDSYFEDQIQGAMTYWASLASDCQKYLESAVSS
ncbi:MAG: HBL/NHE enterotoxin family protein [Bacteroidota bacterium]